MAEQMDFELVSPERLLMEVKAEHIVVPGSEGDFGVLPGHAPFMSTLRPGVIEVYEREDGEPKRLFLKGGFAEVNPDRLIVLAEDSLDPAAVELAELDREIRDAEEDLAAAKNELERRKAEDALAWMRPLRDMLGS